MKDSKVAFRLIDFILLNIAIIAVIAVIVFNNFIVSSLILQFVTVICGFIVPRLIIENFGSNVNGLIKLVPL